MPKEKLKYSMLIEWDDESQCYLVTLPEWKGETNARHITYGHTYEQAAKMGRKCLESLLEVSKAEGDPIPEPATATYEDREFTAKERCAAAISDPDAQPLTKEDFERMSSRRNLEERIEKLEQDVTLEQFIKGLTLLGHKLIIELKKPPIPAIRTKDEHELASKLIDILLDATRCNENHPFEPLLNIISDHVKAYEDVHYPDALFTAKGDNND